MALKWGCGRYCFGHHAFWANWFENYIWCGSEGCWQNTSLGRGHPVPQPREDWAVRGGVETQFSFRVECSDGPPRRRWSFSKPLDWASVLWVWRKPLGIVKGSLRGQGSVEPSLALWLLVRRCLAITLWYFSEGVKLENAILPWLEGEDLNLD